MNLNRSGIYSIRNTINDKQYIGSAVNLRHRRKYHWMALRNNNTERACPILLNAWNKYGEAAFSFSVLEFVDDVEKLIEREQYWLDTHKTYERGVGYNVARVAGSCFGVQRTEEQKKRMSMCKMGDKNPNFSKRPPDHVIEMLVRWTKNNPPSEEKRKLLSEKAMGNKRGLGEKNGHAILTENAVREIVVLLGENKQTMAEIARRYSVHPSTISAIRLGKIWGHVTGGMIARGQIYRSGTQHKNAKLTSEKASEIKNLLKNKSITYTEIASAYGVASGTIWNIKSGRAWKHA